MLEKKWCWKRCGSQLEADHTKAAFSGPSHWQRFRLLQYCHQKIRNQKDIFPSIIDRTVETTDLFDLIEIKRWDLIRTLWLSYHSCTRSGICRYGLIPRSSFAELWSRPITSGTTFIPSLSIFPLFHSIFLPFGLVPLLIGVA